MTNLPNNQMPSSPNRIGFFGKVVDAVESVWDVIWTSSDPVRKVCYDHLAHHYEHKYRTKFPVHHTKVFYFDMFLWFLLSALAVLWFFADSLLPLVPRPQLVFLRATSPLTVISGQDEEYAYEYSNDSDRAVSCAVLRVQLPVGTFYRPEASHADMGAVPTNEKICVLDASARATVLAEQGRGDVLIFPLGILDAHAHDEVRFVARSYGATGDSKRIVAELLYWEEAATAESHVVARNERTVTDALLGLRVTLPEAVKRGLPSEFLVQYGNNGDRDLNGVIVRLEIPEDFVVTGATPAFARTREWQLGTVPAHSEDVLHVRGYFRGGGGRPLVASTFVARGYVREEGYASNVLAEAVRQNADPRAADLSLSQEINQPSGTGVIPAGRTVTASLHYKNEGTETLRNLQFTIDAGAPFVEGGTAGQTQTFDKRADGRLTELKPGDSGMVSATFTVKSDIAAEELAGALFPSLHVTSRGQYTVGDAKDLVLVDTFTADLAIATHLGIEAAALYYTHDGDQLGVGPLPPVEGQPTKYRMFLTLSTTTSAASGVEVTAVLPPNVRWTGSSSVTNGSSIDYLPTQRMLRWSAGALPAFAGGPDTGRIGASFDVELTPSATDVGSAPVLLSDVHAEGKDVATGITLHDVAPPITTDLPFDIRAAGKGVVVGVRPQ